MAKLIVVNPRPKRKPLILGIVIGATFSIIAVSGIKTQPPMSIHLKAIMFIAGVVAIILCLWRLTHDPKLYRSVSRLYKEIRVENDKIVFPKELELKPGILECWYDAGDTDMPYNYTFNETGDAIKVKELGLGDFKGDVSVFAGFDSRRTLPNIKAASVWSEWIRIPAYEIVDKEYKVFGHSIYLAALPPVKQRIALSKTTLFVSDGRDTGQAEIKSKDCLEGVLSFQRSPAGKARGVRLEFTFKTSTVSCKSVIAHLNDTGSTYFKFKVSPDEPVIILASDLFLSTRKIVEKLKDKPIIIGDVWKKGEAKIRLVLDLRRAADLIDEANVFIS